MVTSLDVFADKIVYDSGADRETVAKCLGRGDNVGVAFLGIACMCPESTCSAQAALDLVEDEDCADFCASLSQREKELGRCDVYATLSLDWLYNDTTCGIGD